MARSGGFESTIASSLTTTVGRKKIHTLDTHKDSYGTPENGGVSEGWWVEGEELDPTKCTNG